MSIPFFRDMIFARPECLLLLLALPVMAWWRGKPGRAPTIAFSTTFLLRDLGTQAKSSRGGFTMGLVLLSIAAFLLLVPLIKKFNSVRAQVIDKEA